MVRLRVCGTNNLYTTCVVTPFSYPSMGGNRSAFTTIDQTDIRGLVTA